MRESSLSASQAEKLSKSLLVNIWFTDYSVELFSSVEKIKFSLTNKIDAVFTGDMAEFQRCRKGPGVNTGGLVPGRQKRSSIRGATLGLQCTYVWHARQRLFREVAELFANNMSP